MNPAFTFEGISGRIPDGTSVEIPEGILESLKVIQGFKGGIPESLKEILEDSPKKLLEESLRVILMEYVRNNYHFFRGYLIGGYSADILITAENLTETLGEIIGGVRERSEKQLSEVFLIKLLIGSSEKKKMDQSLVKTLMKFPKMPLKDLLD